MEYPVYYVLYWLWHIGLVFVVVFYYVAADSHFKSHGNNLIPHSPAEQALRYQRMMEALTDKLSKRHTP